jgi:hypothetical protein
LCVSCFNGPVLHNCVNDFIVRASHVKLLFLFMSTVLLQFIVLIQLVGPSAHAWPRNMCDVTHATSILGKQQYQCHVIKVTGYIVVGSCMRTEKVIVMLWSGYVP